MGTPRLDRSFFRQDPIRVARRLLGQRLVHVTKAGRVAGVIVETEAYLGFEDKAAHSFQWRKTERTRTMYLDGGTSYVFLNYGIHHLLNIVVAEVGQPQAVLIRAVEPTEGIELMYRRRTKARQASQLCSGPGKVGAAFGIDRSHDAIDMVTSDSLFVEQLRRRSFPSTKITAAPRIGVDYAEEWAAKPLRFYLSDNPHVSVRMTNNRRSVISSIA